MSQPNNKLPDAAWEREIAQARAEFFARVEAEGTKPFNLDEWRNEIESDQTPEERRREVDDFLALLQEQREIDRAADRSLD